MTWDANDPSFVLLMDKLNQLHDNDTEMKNLIHKHIEKDEAAYKIVDRHSTYWGLLLWVAGMATLAGLSYFGLH